MAALSKLAAVARPLLRPAALFSPSVRASHAPVFRRRPAQLITNRIKDVAHFYLLGIGLFPFLAVVAYAHIVYGPCELQDYPTEGPPPHYWQYERTPLRQWFVKYFGVSDVENHERNLAYYERAGIMKRWHQIEDRVIHLQNERWDYKGWGYQPVSSAWVDQAKWVAKELHDHTLEPYFHYVLE